MAGAVSAFPRPYRPWYYSARVKPASWPPWAALLWISIHGDPERDLPADGAEEYDVRIDASTAAAKATYQFRLVPADLADRAGYSEGPIVTFETPDQEDPAARRRGRRHATRPPPFGDGRFNP